MHIHLEEAGGFVPHWSWYNWLAAVCEGSVCSISDTRRYKSCDLAPSSTSLASEPLPNHQTLSSPPPSPLQPSTFNIAVAMAAVAIITIIACCKYQFTGPCPLHHHHLIVNLGWTWNSSLTLERSYSVADWLRMWVIDEMKQSVRHPGGERGRRGGKRRAPRRRGMWTSVYTKYTQ